MIDSFGNENLTILGIETSCDETAAAVVRNGREVLSNIISSQTDIHTIYGGVVPEIASRLHLDSINQVVRLALFEAGLSFSDIDVIAVTKGPGLVGALLVGVSEAKALSFALKKPLIGVNHIRGHIAANYITHKNLCPPYLGLVVSGGHTELLKVNGFNDFELMGMSHDDAAGESFDKVGRALGLSYPGGPKVDEEAAKGNPEAVFFPRGEVRDRPYDFTFSGLKSNVLNFVNTLAMKNEPIPVADICASFEEAVVDALASRTFSAAENLGLTVIAVSGGVSANSGLRKRFLEEGRERGYEIYFPDPVYCTDNAAMIAADAYYEYLSGVRDSFSMNACPNLEITAFAGADAGAGE